MSSKRIRVQIEQNGRLARTEIWESDQPHAVGFPIRGVLEHTDAGIRFRSLSVSGEGPKPAQVSPFTSEDLIDGATVALPDGGNVSVQWVSELRSPYIQKAEEVSDALGRGVPAVRAYAGSSGSLISSVSVASAYVGYSRNRPVFALYRDGRDFRLRALLPDLNIKYKGEAPEPLPVEREVFLKEEQLARATLLRGRYWWRMTFGSAAPVELPEEDTRKPAAAADWGVEWGTKIAIGLSLFGLFWSTFIASPPLPDKPKPKEIKATALVKVSARRGTPNPQAGAPVQVEDTPPAPAGPTKKAEVAQTPNPAKAPAPPAPAPAQKAPVPTPPKPVVAKSEPAKAPNPAPARTAPTPAKPAPAKAVATNVPPKKAGPTATEIAQARAAAQAKQASNSIQSALGQFMKSSSVPGALNNSAAGGGGAAGPSLSQVQGFGSANVQAESIGTGGGTTVARAGGGGSGNVAGYGSGNAGAVLGTRGGNGVALGTEGLAKEEGLTKEEVWAVIRAHANEVRYCYESALLGTPNLEGMLAIAFKIAPSGAVASAKVDRSTTASRAVDDCIMTKLRTWKFPKPRGGVFVDITYPFTFKNLGGG